MATISVTLPADGQTIDAADYNVPINTIVSEINGSLDSDNIEAGGVTPNSLTSGTGTSWAWQAWVPTFANFTKGSATIDAKYIQIGKTVHFRLNITLSGSTMGTSPTFTLPVTSVTVSTQYPLGQGRIKDANGNGSPAYGAFATTTTAVIRYYNAAANDDAITATVPFTWADTDQISLNGTYEAA